MRHQGSSAQRASHWPKKALPTKGCQDDALACPCLFEPVWLAFGSIFRDDCLRTHVSNGLLVMIAPEPTLKRMAGGRRIFAVRFFVFASPSVRFTAVIVPEPTFKFTARRGPQPRVTRGERARNRTPRVAQPE